MCIDFVRCRGVGRESGDWGGIKREEKDEYLDRGGARVRSWDKAYTFVGDFERLLNTKVCSRPSPLES
jgi:hypothetical protein